MRQTTLEEDQIQHVSSCLCFTENLTYTMYYKNVLGGLPACEKPNVSSSPKERCPLFLMLFMRSALIELLNPPPTDVHDPSFFRELGPWKVNALQQDSFARGFGKGGKWGEDGEGGEQGEQVNEHVFVKMIL